MGAGITDHIGSNRNPASKHPDMWFQSWPIHRLPPLPWKELNQDPPWKTTPTINLWLQISTLQPRPHRWNPVLYICSGMKSWSAAAERAVAFSKVHYS